MFFLGAGASIPSGLNGVIGLVSDLQRYLADNALSKHLELINAVIDILDEWKRDTNYRNDTDLELLLETIERLEGSYHDTLPYFFEDKNLRLRKVDGYDLIANGRECLSEEIKRFVKKIFTLNAKEIGYLEPLISFSSYCRPLDIFSTNYDINIERLCEKLGLQYIDGFDPKWKPKLFYNENCDVRLFKLHGSISWYRTEQGDYERSSIQSLDLRIKLLSGEDAIPIILYPGRKLHYIEPVLEILALLKTKLTKAKYCIVIGYSFKDNHLSQLFKYAARVNKELILILISPEAYPIYYELKRQSDIDFRHGYMHENFNRQNFNVTKASNLEGRVIYLPYNIEKILPLFKTRYLDTLIEAESYVKALSDFPSRDSIDKWKNCLLCYMKCEYLDKVDDLMNKMEGQGLGWNYLLSTNWEFSFEIGLRGLLSSVVSGDVNRGKKWEENLDEIMNPPRIELYLSINGKQVPSEEIVNLMQNTVIPIIRQKRDVLYGNHVRYQAIDQLLNGVVEYNRYLSSWQMSNMTFDTYFELRNDLEVNQLIDLRERYNQFYQSEDERDQESVGRIIQHIERQHFTNHINDVFDVFNI